MRGRDPAHAGDGPSRHPRGPHQELARPPLRRLTGAGDHHGGPASDDRHAPETRPISAPPDARWGQPRIVGAAGASPGSPGYERVASIVTVTSLNPASPPLRPVISFKDHTTNRSA